MKFSAIEVEWASNGRVLPTQAEREDAQTSLGYAAEAVAPRCLTARAIEIEAVDELRANADKYGWDSGDVRRVLADAIVTVSE